LAVGTIMFGTAFLVDKKKKHLVLNFVSYGKKMCMLRLKGKFFNYSLINVHAPTMESEEEGKD
jgi:hypothetical protein